MPFVSIVRGNICNTKQMFVQIWAIFLDHFPLSVKWVGGPRGLELVTLAIRLGNPLAQTETILVLTSST